MAINYQLKWCVIFDAILIIASLLGRPDFLFHLKVSEFIIFCASISIFVFSSWFILAYFLQSNFLRGNKLFKQITANFCAWVVLMLTNYLLAYCFPHSRMITDRQFSTELSNFMARAISCFFLCMICYVVLNNIITAANLQRSTLEIELLKKESLQAQLLSLQQQLSPHFLFNSLSTLTTIAKDQETKDYIVQLSKIYRHLLAYKESDLVSLKDELDFLKSYLFILEMRFEGSLQISLDVKDQFLSYFLPPLSLQLLAENAIKHNIATPEQPLCLAIYTLSSPMIVVENNYNLKSTTNKQGTGLKNINDRYLLLLHKPISVSTEQDKFRVTLPLLKR